MLIIDIVRPLFTDAVLWRCLDVVGDVVVEGGWLLLMDGNIRGVGKCVEILWVGIQKSSP